SSPRGPSFRVRGARRVGPAPGRRRPGGGPPRVLAVGPWTWRPPAGNLDSVDALRRWLLFALVVRSGAVFTARPRRPRRRLALVDRRMPAGLGRRLSRLRPRDPEGRGAEDLAGAAGRGTSASGPPRGRGRGPRRPREVVRAAAPGRGDPACGRRATPTR